MFIQPLLKVSGPSVCEESTLVSSSYKDTSPIRLEPHSYDLT